MKYIKNDTDYRKVTADFLHEERKPGGINTHRLC